MGTDPAAVRSAILAFLDESGLEHETTGETLVVVLPGVKKLRTTVSLSVGPTHVVVNAFVIRHPDENEEAFYRWLLKRNRRIFSLAYAIDHLGDVYLTGHIPNAAVSPDELDRILGTILENADETFNTLLELGFSTAIRQEWQWRLSRGESTANLEAFRHLAPAVDPAAAGPDETGPETGTDTGTDAAGE